jgi:phospholipase D1/2
MRRGLFRLLGLFILIGAVLAVWRYSPLGEWGAPSQLGAWLDRLSASTWAGPLVVAGFLLGSFVIFPVTAMIAATGIALGPTDGLLWASLGALAGATTNYGLARLVPERTIERWVGPWVGKMGQRFKRGGIVAIMLARNLPFAPYTLINVVAGGARIPFCDYMIGTVLGMGPIIAALTILGDRLRGAWEAPTAGNMLLLALAILFWFVLAWGLQWLSNRLAAARRLPRWR